MSGSTAGWRWRSIELRPFALSLSKGRPRWRQGFDKLSPNGVDARDLAEKLSPNGVDVRDLAEKLSPNGVDVRDLAEKLSPNGG